ncbi:MAG: GAF domain-containing protein [Myxococcota bacterium]
MSTNGSIDGPPLLKFRRVLGEQGIVAALRLLNSRAPHRFTGLYRYDGEMLRNLHLVDAFDPELVRGADVAMEDAYCAVVHERRQSIAFRDAKTAPEVTWRPGSPVVSYCGVLLTDGDGAAFGALCHFDVKPCDRPATEMELLENAAPILMAALEAAR